MNSEVKPTQGRAGAVIKCESVSRNFGGRGLVLDGVSFEVESGEFVALLGPSGSGKSTLLRLTAGLDFPNQGRLVIEGSNGALSRGFVFQEATLMPWRTVLRNTMLPLELAGRTKAESEFRAMEELRRVRLADFSARYPHELSGGMKMRASVARALTTRPNLLLLDEPFAALDEPSRHGLQLQLREIWRSLGMTVLFVTHSVTEAVFLADRVLLLSQRPGRLLFDRRVSLPGTRDAELRTSLEYNREVRRVMTAMPVAQEAS